MSAVCNKCGKHWAYVGHESGQCIYCLGLVEGSAGLGDMPDPVTEATAIGDGRDNNPENEEIPELQF